MTTKTKYLKSVPHYGEERCSVCKGINQPYMIQFHLWNSLVKKKDRLKLICIECIESRLKRRLVASDFTDAPINFGIFGFDCSIYTRLPEKDRK